MQLLSELHIGAAKLCQTYKSVTAVNKSRLSELIGATQKLTAPMERRVSSEPWTLLRYRG